MDVLLIKWLVPFFISIVLLLYLFFHNFFSNKEISKRLTGNSNYLLKKTKKKNTAFLSFIMQPLKQKLINFTPDKQKHRLEMLCEIANCSWNLGDLIMLKLIIALTSSITTYFFLEQSAVKTTTFILVTASLGFMAPDFYLNRKAKKRQQSIRQSLTSFIDYLTISVEAGLGLDLAITRVLRKLEGPLAEEFTNTMTQIKYGKPKKEAFKDLAHKVKVPELSTFLTALINGEQLGISLGQILRIQGEQNRDKRKQRIKEKAYKIPIKLLFPLVFFILPGIFVVLLGPAIMNIGNLLLKR